MSSIHLSLEVCQRVSYDFFLHANCIRLMMFYVATAVGVETIVRAAVGLLPDLSPYKRADAYLLARKGSVLAMLILCEHYNLKELKAKIDADLVSAPEELKALAKDYEGDKNPLWFSIMEKAFSEQEDFDDPEVRGMDFYFKAVR
jgi:hypothetical protein